MGPLQLACVIGFFLLRQHPVFAIRVPKVVLGCMMLKLISFFCVSWLFLDPNCPCIISSIVFWLDLTANLCHILRKIVLLFRYEIQAALEQTKLESNAKVFDNRNFFVRYRQILRAKVQFALICFVACCVGVPLLIVAAVWSDLAMEPCTTAITGDDPLVLATILCAFIGGFLPMGISIWSARRLKKFPDDNWKMGVESSVQTFMSTLAGLGCVLVLCLVPTFDGLLFLMLNLSIVSQLLNFVMPMQLHRKMVHQLATMDLAKLTSLRRLLQDTEFLACFDAYLRKEFSSENLFFWQEVNTLQKKYKALFPERTDLEELHSRTSAEKAASCELGRDILTKAAEDCRALGRKCIGDQAPCQINVSGFTGQDMAKAIEDVNELMGKGENEHIEHELKLALEEAIKTLVVAQREVYELLRKDSYPRFLLSSAAEKLNKNDHFKRLLAAERLEGEVQKTHTETTETSSPDSKSSTSEKTPQKQSKTRLSCELAIRSVTLCAPAVELGSRGSSGSVPEKPDTTVDIGSAAEKPDATVDIGPEPVLD
jgi:hypothetical protein